MIRFALVELGRCLDGESVVCNHGFGTNLNTFMERHEAELIEVDK